ncbi:MAG: hypothetical protein K2R93_21725 [Gemmatimonadaceae bacterium]|nr:hypothetical protein [Gemmatimonadaceae bacterium]
MTATSDPFLHRVDARPTRSPSAFPGARQPLAPHAEPLLPARRAFGARLMARAFVLSAASLIALRAIAGWVAQPLLPAGYTNPKWKVELTTTSAQPTVAVAFHREHGLHLYRIPGNASGDDRRILPFDMAHGELYLLSLGWGQLDVRGRGPRWAEIASFSAVGRTVRVFSHAMDTGIRTGW